MHPLNPQQEKNITAFPSSMWQMPLSGQNYPFQVWHSFPGTAGLEFKHSQGRGLGSAYGHCDLGRAKSFISPTAESQHHGEPHTPRGTGGHTPSRTENTTAVWSLSDGEACSTFKPLLFKRILQDGNNFISFVLNSVRFPVHLFNFFFFLFFVPNNC